MCLCVVLFMGPSFHLEPADAYRFVQPAFINVNGKSRST